MSRVSKRGRSSHGNEKEYGISLEVRKTEETKVSETRDRWRNGEKTGSKEKRRKKVKSQRGQRSKEK